MVKSFLFFVSIFFLFIDFSLAHPGIGIVSDSHGNVYYTDLKQVWKITPEGEKSIYVPDVHTHELYMDDTDVLFGENAWYEGEETDKWGFSVWKKINGNELEFMIDSTEGFLFEHPFGFVRDSDGNMYWKEKLEEEYLFKRKNNVREEEILARGNFENIRWCYFLNDHFYFIDMDDLYRIYNGEIELIAKDLKSEAKPFSDFVRDMHSIMGIWDDKTGNIYVAVYSGKVLKKINPGGEVTEFFKSKGDWSPASGLFDEKGNLWLMEYSTKNDVRVRKITKEEIENDSMKMGTEDLIKFWDPFIALAVLAIGLLLIKVINNLKS